MLQPFSVIMGWTVLCFEILLLPVIVPRVLLFSTFMNRLIGICNAFFVVFGGGGLTCRA